MKVRLCNKCMKPIEYPFYAINYKELPKKVKEKSSYSDRDWEHTIYPSKPCADICSSCWKKLGIKINLKTFDSVPFKKEEKRIVNQTTS